MRMSDVRKKARLLGINRGRLTKAETIRRIQVAEGRQPCFGRSGRACHQADCEFMEACMLAVVQEGAKDADRKAWLALPVGGRDPRPAVAWAAGRF